MIPDIPLSKQPLYFTWRSIINRCTRPTNPLYKYYGALGVKVHPSWLTSYETFIKDVGDKPSKAYSLDRINPTGNYESGNVRWATWHQQASNKRNSQEYVGISHPSPGKWVATVWKDGVKLINKSFDSRDEAINARIEILLKHNIIV